MLAVARWRRQEGARCPACPGCRRGRGCRGRMLAAAPSAGPRRAAARSPQSRTYTTHPTPPRRTRAHRTFSCALPLSRRGRGAGRVRRPRREARQPRYRWQAGQYRGRQVKIPHQQDIPTYTPSHPRALKARGRPRGPRYTSRLTSHISPACTIYLSASKEDMLSRPVRHVQEACKVPARPCSHLLLERCRLSSPCAASLSSRAGTAFSRGARPSWGLWHPCCPRGQPPSPRPEARRHQ